MAMEPSKIINKKFNTIKNSNDKSPISYHTEIDNDPDVKKFIENEVIKGLIDEK